MLLTTKIRMKEAFLKNSCGVSRITTGQIQLLNIVIETYKANFTIDSNSQVFIPTAKANQLTKNYRQILDACCIFKGYYNWDNSTCDLIIGWREEFVDFCISMMEWEFRQISKLAGKKKLNDAEKLLDWDLRPGADKNNYKQTDNSCRYYAKVQNMPRDMKKQVFKGCIDADMVNCHANLFLKYVLDNVMPEQNDFKMMLQEPEEFIRKIVDTNAFTNGIYWSEGTERCKAKRMRARLFNPKPGQRLKNIGVEWYDALANFIYDALSECGIDNSHKFFTAIEQQRIDEAVEAVGPQNVVSNMHDGLLLDGPANLDLQSLEEILSRATGMQWKCSRF